MTALDDIPRCVLCGQYLSYHWDFPDRCEGFVHPKPVIRMKHTNIQSGEPTMPTKYEDVQGLPIETDAQRQQRTNLSSLEQTDRESAAVQKTDNRVTLGSMVAKIANVEYIRPINLRHMTICVITMRNGWALVGKSAPVDAANFNLELGQKFAYEDALRQCWQLEGYLLRERLYNQRDPDFDEV